MSSSNLAKKLLPIWKSFTKTLKSKLKNLNISKFLREKTRYCLTSLQSFPVKLWALCTRRRQHLQMNIDAIYVDQLFEGKNKANEMGATSGSNAENYKAKAEKVTSFPQLQGIDERAEEFISKFREEMKLQREQSLLEFQEMLARSA